MTPSHSLDLAQWVLALRADDLPDDIVETVKLRLLDTIGLILAAADAPLAQAARPFTG